MVEDATLSADRSTIIFSANTGADRDDGDRRHLYAVPVDKAKTRVLTAGDGIEWGPVVNGANQLFLMSSTAQRPPLPATLPTPAARHRCVRGVAHPRR
jgi:Tol biopolymer transport system component